MERLTYKNCAYLQYHKILHKGRAFCHHNLFLSAIHQTCLQTALPTDYGWEQSSSQMIFGILYKGSVHFRREKKDSKYIFKVSLHTTSFFRALKWQKAHSIQWLYFSSLCFLLSFVKIATFNNPKLIFKYYRQFYTVAYSVTYKFTKIHMYFYTYCSSIWFNIKHEIKLQSIVNVNITITEELLVFHIKWVKAYIYSTNIHQSCLNYHLKQFQVSWITILKSNVKIMQLTFVITNRPGLNAINHSI